MSEQPETPLDTEESTTAKQTPQALAPERIPRVGHICWFGPHRPPMELMETWVKTNPTIMWSIWKDHTGWENQAQIDVRARRNEWNGVCDIIRYELLYRYGGICVDADSTAVKPLVEGDFFDQETAVACYENESVRPGMIGCGFLGAPRSHPFFRACIDDVKTQSVDEQAWKAVGPMLMGRVAAKMPNAIKVYPARMFNPTHYTGTKAPGDAPIFAEQGWGSTRGYNVLRKIPCGCRLCMTTSLRPPWG